MARDEKGIPTDDIQKKMTGNDLKLRDMIRYKNKGSGTSTCTEQDYRGMAGQANVNAYDHDNYRNNPHQVIEWCKQ